MSAPARAVCGCALIVAAALLGRAAPRAETNPAPGATGGVVWRALAPGAEKGITDGGDSRLVLFRFDLDRYDAEVVVTGRERPRHARIWMAGARHTAAEIVNRGGAGAGVVVPVVAAVNGGFFDENGRSLGLRMIHGDAAVPLRRNVDWGVFYVAGRRARIVHSRDFVAAATIEAAIQVGPRILIDGAVPGLKPQIARRTAVALDREGKTLTLVVASTPVDATSLGHRLAALGFHSALLLDGGPSTQLAVALDPAPAGAAAGARTGAAGEDGHLDIPGGYGVPDLLAIVRR